MQARTKRTIAVLAVGFAAFATTSAQARKAGKPKAPPPPNADQQEVIAQIVNDTFRRPRVSPLTFALCLDVQIEAAFDEDEAPPPPPRHGRRKPAPLPEVPSLPVVRGAPPELVAALARPWRVVVSALSCRLDPRAPFTVNDAAHSPAQLVTVHLSPDVASGTVKIDWTSGHDPTGGSSRDCTATRASRGWSVQCGGTWFQ